MVNVTTEALKMVKDSLSNFLTDVEGVASRADSRSSEVVSSCKTQVNQAKNDVSQSEARIAALTREISQAEGKIQSTTNEINSITTRIPQMQSRIRSLDSQIMNLESQISALRAQLSNCDDPDQREQIQTQIDMLQNRVSQCRSEQQSLENELRNLEDKKAQLQQQLNATKSQKAQLESERSSEKNRCNKLKEKLERLKTAFGRVESDLRAYVSAAKKFETTSSDSTQKNVSAVEKCIASIEEYEQVSLGDSFHGNESNRQSQNSSDSYVDWNSTMNTQQELQKIMEMEENGDFDFSAIDLLSSNRTMSGRHLPTPITISLPANTRRYSLEDFAEQVLGQEDGLNSLTVYDFLTNYENRQNNGRDTNSSSAQQEYRQALVEVITEDIMSENPELSFEDARNDALSCVGVLAALHNPDQIVGGSGHGVTGAGRRNVNSALGSLWRHGRAQELYEQVREASSGWSEAEMRNTYLNVRLRVEDRFG